MKKKITEILKNYNNDRSQLISILQDIQSEYRYLPREALKQVSKVLEIPLTQVYGVATFFRSFSIEPRGKHTVHVCTGTACHVRGSLRILEEMERELGIPRGKTTADSKFTLETVNCVGACALGPIAVVDGEYNGQMTPDKVKSVLEKYR
ncbi:MAG: NADH-quinone oxidoreductase subunit NuoE [Dehalococcoidales bacterium]|nr:NADH-quinone oxidoreductase subunit NuoE [Dehalococcoidales bacterium]